MTSTISSKIAALTYEPGDYTFNVGQRVYVLFDGTNDDYVTCEAAYERGDRGPACGIRLHFSSGEQRMIDQVGGAPWPAEVRSVAPTRCIVVIETPAGPITKYVSNRQIVPEDAVPATALISDEERAVLDGSDPQALLALLQKTARQKDAVQASLAEFEDATAAWTSYVTGSTHAFATSTGWCSVFDDGCREAGLPVRAQSVRSEFKYQVKPLAPPTDDYLNRQNDATVGDYMRYVTGSTPGDGGRFDTTAYGAAIRPHLLKMLAEWRAEHEGLVADESRAWRWAAQTLNLNGTIHGCTCDHLSRWLNDNYGATDEQVGFEFQNLSCPLHKHKTLNRRHLDLTLTDEERAEHGITGSNAVVSATDPRVVRIFEMAGQQFHPQDDETPESDPF